MGNDLGARLVQAGLVTRAQLDGVLGHAPANEGALVCGLAEAGLDEDALAGFFVALGHGPLVDAEELRPDEVATAARLPGRMAHALVALPLRESPAGLLVAMAAPTDAHACAELARAAGAPIVPTVARASELRRALARVYRDVVPSDPPAMRESEPPVLELVRRRDSSRPAEGVYGGSTRGADRVEARALVGPRIVSDDDEPFVPLVRHKPVGRDGERGRKKVITKDFERQPTRDSVIEVGDGEPGEWGPTKRARPRPEAPLERAAKEAAERVARERESAAPTPLTRRARPKAPTPAPPPSLPPAPSERPASSRHAQPPPPPSSPPSPPPIASDRPGGPPRSRVAPTRAASRSIIPPEHERWDEDLPPNKVDPTTLRRFPSSPPKRPPRPAPIGGTLAAIRASRERDEVVELACQGALTVCRAAVLLALRKNVLKGWGGAGVGLSRDAIRNLWIPTSSPSMFRDVATRGEPYVGAHGTSAADGLFRAALGSRGGEVALMPVHIGDKLVAVLAASELRFGTLGVERIEILARAVGEALERIIVDAKKRG